MSEVPIYAGWNTQASHGQLLALACAIFSTKVLQKRFFPPARQVLRRDLDRTSIPEEYDLMTSWHNFFLS
jgi:hypothetical protein